MKKTLISAFACTMLLAAPLQAETQVKQIALNASTIVYGTINTGGLGAAVKEIRTCYDAVKTRDHFLHCLSMDIQAKRFDGAVSARSNLPPDDFFSDAVMDERVRGLERWYPSASQLDYVMNQLMDGLEQGTKAELQRAERK
jgi:hypothetical protein